MASAFPDEELIIDLHLDPRHAELGAVARRLFETRCPLTEVRALESDPLGYGPDLWHEMARLDWIGLTYPRALGGSDGTLLDLAMIYREMGRALAPSPHLPAAVIAGEALAAANGSAHAPLLADIISGDAIVVPALMDAAMGYGIDGVTLAAREEPEGVRIQDGVKVLVPYAHVARHLLVATRTAPAPDGVTLLLVAADDPGVAIQPMANVASQPLYEVTLRGVTVPTSAVVGAVGHGGALLAPALARATVLRCAEIIGGGERLMELAVGYATNRQQFGTAIGHFQAVQYLCSDIAIDVHLTSLLTWQAAFAIDQGVDASKEVAMAKSYASIAAQRMAHRTHEVYAGAGFMMETDVQLFTRRLKHWEYDLGDAHFHDEAVAAELAR